MEELKNRKVSVALDQETYEKLVLLAKQDLRPVSGFIRQVMRRYIRSVEAGKQKPSPPDALQK